MIYFDQNPPGMLLVRRFWEAMRPGPTSYFFISHSGIPGPNPLFRLVAPSIYQKVAVPGK